jgi:hypothetical protein
MDRKLLRGIYQRRIRDIDKKATKMMSSHFKNALNPFGTIHQQTMAQSEKPQKRQVLPFDEKMVSVEPLETDRPLNGSPIKNDPDTSSFHTDTESSFDNNDPEKKPGKPPSLGMILANAKKESVEKKKVAAA